MNRTMPQQRREQLIVQALPPHEVLIYDLSRDRAHSLNHTATLVWEQCDGVSSWDDAIAALQAAGIAADDDLVALSLKRLSKAHLLEAPVDLPSSAGVSRRQFIQRSAGMSLALMLPLVSSVRAPEPWQTSSTGGSSTPPPGTTPTAGCTLMNKVCGPGFAPCCPGLKCSSKSSYGTCVPA